MKDKQLTYFDFLKSNILRVLSFFFVMTAIRWGIDGKVENIEKRALIWLGALFIFAGYQYWKYKQERNSTS